jgi:hypothetical protein
MRASSRGTLAYSAFLTAAVIGSEGRANVAYAKLERGGLYVAQDAIREAASDGNPKTAPDSNWTPLIVTPPHPNHPAGHTCQSAAISTTLTYFFGANKVPFSTYDNLTGNTRSYASFSQALKEVIDARVRRGIRASRAPCRSSLHAGRDWFRRGSPLP